MKIYTRLMLAGIMGLGMTATTQTSAFAWSCQAQARDGTWGYSYNYPRRRGAERRALNECAARTYRTCYIVQCNRNG
jgi:hypothetical protein